MEDKSKICWSDCHQVPLAESKKWLKHAKVKKDDFWLGEENIQASKDIQNNLNHIVVHNQTTLCKLPAKNTFHTTYIDLYLNADICSTCRARFQFTPILRPGINITNVSTLMGIGTAYENALLLITHACMMAEEVKKCPPKAYSDLWNKAAFMLAVLYRNKKEEQLLLNKAEEAIEQLEAYLKENPGKASDQGYKNYMQEALEKASVPNIIQELIQWRNELTKENTSKAPILYLISSMRHDLTIEELKKATREELQEILTEELTTLQEKSTQQLKEIPGIMKSLEESPLHLVKINDGAVTHNPVQTCLYASCFIYARETRGTLVPNTLLKGFKERNSWPHPRYVKDLGEVLKTDLPEIFETAIGLDLPSDNALLTSRLLYK